ncbi:ATP-dependent Clp protease proteolytic subunit [Ananas comosus]|uniref:ATP-dependent Clp protease proteolytic subunit n=1 Tax=Ananas comosus TaxID=4615 RepID=A0A199W8W2_ANACO|nr:ATP-dependent Clp protease proteolytic subunit [Ananas comosus]
MIHEPSGGFLGQASDKAIHAKEILKLRERLYAIYVRHTHQPVHWIECFMERDTYMSPAEAKKFGLIDAVIQNCPIATDVSGGGGGCGDGKRETEEDAAGGGGGDSGSGEGKREIDEL